MKRLAVVLALLSSAAFAQATTGFRDENAGTTLMLDWSLVYARHTDFWMSLRAYPSLERITIFQGERCKMRVVELNDDKVVLECRPDLTN